MPRASVIIPAYNAAATIGRTLEALSVQDVAEPFEVLVVDDGSTDGTLAMLEARGRSVRMLRQDHRGPGEARNLGARAARGEVLAFTDADCVPAPQWLREGLAAIREADLVQGAVRPDPSVPRMPFDRTVWVTRESGLYECASLFVRRDLFERIGGFQDWLGARIGKQLAEDAWLGWRARRAGARTCFSGRALVDHAVFRRSAAEYAAERVRLVYFPVIARKIPELRRRFFYRRWFLTSRSAAFDAALAGGTAAALSGSPVALVMAAPYLAILLREAQPWGRQAAKVVGAGLAADAIGFGALAVGSVRHRSPVL